VLGLRPQEFAWLAAGAALLAFELIVIGFHPRGADVLTQAWRANALRWIIIPLGSGVLLGHLNGPSFNVIPGRWAPAVFIVVCALALAHGLFIRTPAPEAARMPMFLVGFIIGAVSWRGSP
jgi:hypothetical protein